jgi:hypothetical protein
MADNLPKRAPPVGHDISSRPKIVFVLWRLVGRGARYLVAAFVSDPNPIALAEQFGTARADLVHELDREPSGLIIAVKDSASGIGDTELSTRSK